RIGAPVDFSSLQAVAERDEPAERADVGDPLRADAERRVVVVVVEARAGALAPAGLARPEVDRAEIPGVVVVHRVRGLRVRVEQARPQRELRDDARRDLVAVPDEVTALAIGIQVHALAPGAR